MARDYSSDVQNIINTKWNSSQGYVVPTTDNVTLAGGAKKIEATFLYADLASSSRIAKELDQRVAAKFFKSFLQCSTNLISSNSGTVISFDGDRALGVFMGNTKNTNAAKCGLQINYVVKEIIKTKFENTYDSVKNASFNISHGVGIDTGEVLVVRGGVRGNNDLISIGRAPNLAAKLSDIRNSTYKTHITSSVYNSLAQSSKFGGSESKNMWEKASWEFLGDNLNIYRSSWQWRP